MLVVTYTNFPFIENYDTSRKSYCQYFNKNFAMQTILYQRVLNSDALCRFQLLTEQGLLNGGRLNSRHQ